MKRLLKVYNLSSKNMCEKLVGWKSLLKGLIKADLCTNFGRNPMNIHGVMTDYLRKIRSKVCHAYRVNPLEESVEN